MILTCPSCGTQYVVKDGVIPPGGRQVRCASCKHSWHQDAEESAAADPAAEPAGEWDSDASETGADEGIAEATLIEPRSGPEAEERAYEEAALDSGDESLADEPLDAELPPKIEIGGQTEAADEAPEEAAVASDFRAPPDAEATSDEFTPIPGPDEETPARRSPAAMVAIIVLLIVVAAAAFWFLAPPEWKARLGLSELGTSPLALVTTHMDRQKLESGNELLTVTGRVINPTGKEQNVPPLQAQLKTRTGRVVYSWTIAPPARSLAPGASATFNSAEVNVPPGGDELTITLGSG
jgi:predicted Zn finger-like uncharacterized protein